MHPSTRHLYCLYEQLTLTDKVVHAYSLGPERVEDAMEMAKIASGLDEKEFFSKPRIFTNINSTSPLKHDWPMLDGAMRFAKKKSTCSGYSLYIGRSNVTCHHRRIGSPSVG